MSSVVSDQKTGVNFIEDPFYMTSHLSLTAFKILFLSLFFSGLIIVCVSVDLFEFIFLRTAYSTILPLSLLV